ncbi:hypothetical protein [Glaesserella parasuis]|uniref:hypothetical protein n=1 Tax=Glaesserella parasuis TaxID=738 RepID=UPI0013289403|nr:hypothetical protein [Glaesserella parasuis]MWQ12045.1 hypothetical protein [Glaesserella parasuis]
MNFFDILGRVAKAISRSVGNSMENHIIELWNKLKNLDNDRFISFINSKDTLNTQVYISVLSIYSKSINSYYDFIYTIGKTKYNKDEIIRGTLRICKSNIIQLSNKREMNEIRQIANKFATEFS